MHVPAYIAAAARRADCSDRVDHTVRRRVNVTRVDHGEIFTAGFCDSASFATYF